MVSFEDIRNIRLHYNDSQKPENLRVTTKLITLWIFTVCYLISINASKTSTSIMSLLGMYYAIGDIVTYFYVNYILKRNEDENHNQETEDIVNEVINDVDDDTDSDLTSDMMPHLFRKTTNSEDENYNQNEEVNRKALQQLREFEQKIRQKNLGLDEYSDLPPLIKADSIDSSSTNLLNYMNPYLRQPGQYAASLNETDE